MSARVYAGAGIATDGSVGAQVTIAGANAGPGTYLIPQALGTLSGNNLFHSFSSFNVDVGQTATFTTSTNTIANVISRVSGGASSQINGLMRLAPAAGSAPAFHFINPAGIVFGAGASIDVPGAFHVGTADDLKFADGGMVYADLGKASTLSSASPAAFGFLGTTRATVTVKDGAILAAKPSQPISLVAGDVGLNNGRVSTLGGDIRVAAIGQAVEEVGLTGDLPAATGKLDLLNGGRILSTSSGSTDAGAISVSAGNFSIDSQGRYSNTGIFDLAYPGSGNAGPVKVNADAISIDGRGTGYYVGIFSQAWYGTGNAGRIDVTATGAITLVDGGQISADTYTAGNAGAVKVGAGSIAIDTGSYISSDTLSDGKAGSVDVSTIGDISIDNGGEISSSTYSSGNAGSVSVNASSININNSGIIVSDAWSTGNAGSVSLKATGDVFIDNDSIISADTYSHGDAGMVTLHAVNVTLDHDSFISSDTLFAGGSGSVSVMATGDISMDYGGTISSSTFSSSHAGGIELSAKGTLSLAHGSAIYSDAFSSGDAGEILVEVGSIAIDGLGGSGFTGILSQADMGSSGKSGSVQLSSGGILIQNGGSISTDTFSSGSAGSIEVTATVLSLVNGGQVSSNSYAAGNAGTISVHAGSVAIDGLNLESPQTGIFSLTAGQTGQGGDISIHADSLSLLRFGLINAETDSSGKGGAIDVQVHHLSLNEGGTISTLSAGKGDAGDILIQAADDVAISGVSNVSFERDYDGQRVIGEYSGIYLNSQGSGNGGNLQLSSRQLSLSDGGVISAIAVDGALASLPETRAGNIRVDAGTIVLTGGGAIDASTSGAGQAGSVIVNADASITISGSFDHALHPEVTNPLEFDQSHIGSSATHALNPAAKSLGAGGDVTVMTPALILRDGGQISVATEGAQRAGSIAVNVGTLVIDGASSRVSAEAAETSSGQTGQVSVTADDLTLSNGGQISIANRATVADPFTLTPTSIGVSAPSIHILNSPDAITTASTGNVAAGSIRIDAADLLHLDPSGITTTANAGNGGAIGITAGLLWLQDSQIATSVTGLLNGNGGDINITASSLILNTGFIQANTTAAHASGGLVSISAQNLVPSGNTLFLGGSSPYGYRPGAFGFNVIQAAAPTGVSGVVRISSPALDLSASLVGLDTSMVDGDALAHYACEDSGGSSLIVAGRGGLPPGAQDFLGPDPYLSRSTAPEAKKSETVSPQGAH